MKKKILITLAIFSLVLLITGTYIIVSIERGTSSLDNLIQLHQVEILREQLLIQLKRIQADLFLKNTRYARGAATMVDHVRTMDKTMDECFDCHHAEHVTIVLNQLDENIEQYKDAVSRILTIRADLSRLESEEDIAYNIGNSLQNKINHIIAIANKKLEDKTKQTLKTIDISKKILFTLVGLGPLIAAALALFFIRGFTKPIDVLLEATRRIKNVDLNYRISEPLHDEFGELAKAFNEMSSSLEQQCNKMQRADQLTVYGEMAAGLAHEIKNPLAGIKGAMNLFRKDSSITDENKIVLGKVIGEIRRIESLMKELLSYARPPKPQFMLICFNEILEKTSSLLPKYPRFLKDGSKEIHIVKDFVPDLPEVETDPMQMQQVFLNLFLNAADAMPEGGTLTVKTLCDPLDAFIQIVVSDTGQGMKEDVKAKLFMPFFTTKKKGTGLGLATSKRLIEQHGGTIGVENNEGGGVAFTIRLPIKQMEKE